MMAGLSVSDALIGPLWLWVNVILFMSAWVLSRRLYPRDGVLQIAGHCIVISWGVIVGTATFLGTVGWLGQYVLPLVVAGLCGLALSAFRLAYPEAGSRWALWPSRSGQVEELTEPSSFPMGGVAKWFWFTVWILLLGFAIDHVITNGILNFPSDYDSLMYHMPLIDQWLAARSLYAPHCAHWSFSANNELLGLWMVCPFSGDFLISLNNLPALILLVLASFELASNVGLSNCLQHVIALALVGNTIVRVQIYHAENDLAVATLFFACTAYGVRYVRDSRLPDSCLAGICLGLLVGIKFYSVGYAAILWALITLLAFWAHGFPGILRTTLVGGLGAMLLGGYWYIRNTLVTGRPFFPLGSMLANDELSIIYPDVWRTTILGNRHPDILPLAARGIWNILGPPYWAAFLALPFSVPMLLITGTWLKRDQTKELDGKIRVVLALMMILSAVVPSLLPFAAEDIPGTLDCLRSGYNPVRYAWCFLHLSLLGLAVCLHDLFVWLRVRTGQSVKSHTLPPSNLLTPSVALAKFLLIRAIVFTPLLLFVGAVLYQIANSCKDWLLGVDVSERLVFVVAFLMFSITLLLMQKLSPRRRHLFVFVLSVALTLGASFGCSRLSSWWHQGYAHYYDRMFGGTLFRELAQAEPTSPPICILDFNRSYPFFGSRRQHRVCQPLRTPSFPFLVDYLRSHKVALLAVGYEEQRTAPGWNRFRGVEHWLTDYPAVFVPIKKERMLCLLQVKLDSLAESASARMRDMSGSSFATLPFSLTSSSVNGPVSSAICPPENRWRPRRPLTPFFLASPSPGPCNPPPPCPLPPVGMLLPTYQLGQGGFLPCLSAKKGGMCELKLLAPNGFSALFHEDWHATSVAQKAWELSEKRLYTRESVSPDG